MGGQSGFSSPEYWNERYKNNGNSGAGSYKHLAGFKANVLNSFIKDHGVQSVIEFGCGDGNQLLLADYPKYVGFDVSPKSIQICKDLFKGDPSKSFYLSPPDREIKADLSMSLDVIYHLVEDEVFNAYMLTLFASATQWVIIYSSNTNENHPDQSIHVKHRKFSDWIDSSRLNYQLHEHIPNEFPMSQLGENGSFADFFIYKRKI